MPTDSPPPPPPYRSTEFIAEEEEHPSRPLPEYQPVDPHLFEHTHAHHHDQEDPEITNRREDLKELLDDHLKWWALRSNGIATADRETAKIAFEAWVRRFLDALEYEGYDKETKDWYWKMEWNQINQGVRQLIATAEQCRNFIVQRSDGTFTINRNFANFATSLHLRRPSEWREQKLESMLRHLREAVTGGRRTITYSEFDDWSRAFTRELHTQVPGNYAFVDTEDWKTIRRALKAIRTEEWVDKGRIPGCYLNVKHFVASLRLERNPARAHDHNATIQSLEHRRIGRRQAQMRKMETFGVSNHGGVFF